MPTLTQGGAGFGMAAQHGFGASSNLTFYSYQRMALKGGKGSFDLAGLAFFVVFPVGACASAIGFLRQHSTS
jgi:hypothetical protein